VWSGRNSSLIAAGLTAAALMLVPARAGAVTFFSEDVPVGTNPTSVAVGDFNGGAPDLAVANEGSDNVSILLGNGLGKFSHASAVSVGDAPSTVVTGLFNDDAFTDLAIASVGNDNIAIRLGDGTGGFTGTGTVTTGVDPRAIATGDFNEDGDVDLVAANTGSSTVSILLGDGLGGFATDATPQDVDGPAANPTSIATIGVGEIEADPDLDVMITSQTDDQLLTLLGDGTGGFNGSQTHYVPIFSATNPNPNAIAVGSLNPTINTEPDILVANQGLDHVLPGYGRLDGGSFDFGGAPATGDAPAGVAFGDFDGDGDQDGISADSGVGTATVLISDGGGGTAADTSTSVGSSPRAVAAGSFDADAKADAAVANHGSGTVTVLTSLAPPVTPGPTPKPKKKCKKKKGKKRSAAAAKKKKCKKKKRK